MIFEEIKGGSLLAPVPDDHGGASDNLPLITLGIQLAEASILAELHVVGYSQEGNLMFLAQSLNKLLICGLVTVLSQDAQKSLKYEKKANLGKMFF